MQRILKPISRNPTPVQGNPKAFRVPVLVSYAFLRELNDAKQEALITNPRIELLLDSGAFTAKNAGITIDLNDYITFLKRYEKHFKGYIALDVLQDPKGTDKNLQKMLDAGLSPIPVHVYGDDQARMDYLFARSSWVALGGLRRPHRGSSSKEYVTQKMSWAKGRPVHWLGYTDQRMLISHKPYSCDCASAARGNMYGGADFYLGRGKWFQNVRPPRPGSDKETIGRFLLTDETRHLIDLAGVTEAEYYDPVQWTGAKDNVGARITHYSWVAYAAEMLQVHSVRVFIAQVPNIFEANLAPMIDRYHANKGNAPCLSSTSAASPVPPASPSIARPGSQPRIAGPTRQRTTPRSATSPTPTATSSTSAPKRGSITLTVRSSSSSSRTASTK